MSVAILQSSLYSIEDIPPIEDNASWSQSKDRKAFQCPPKIPETRQIIALLREIRDLLKDLIQPSRTEWTMKFARILGLLCILTFIAHAASVPEGDWKAGVLRSTSSSSHSQMLGVLNQGHGVLTERTTTWMFYVIDGFGYSYEGRQTLKHSWNKPLNVTVHGPIKYAIKGHDIFILDDDGKTQKLDLVEKFMQPR